MFTSAVVRYVLSGESHHTGQKLKVSVRATRRLGQTRRVSLTDLAGTLRPLDANEERWRRRVWEAGLVLGMDTEDMGCHQNSGRGRCIRRKLGGHDRREAASNGGEEVRSTAEEE